MRRAAAAWAAAAANSRRLLRTALAAAAVALGAAALWPGLLPPSAGPRACPDALASAGAPYARPFPAPSSFGRPGLSHATLHGALHHGARGLELWAQAFAPGAATPVHWHPCEEAFVVLEGEGTLFSLPHPWRRWRWRRSMPLSPVAVAFGANSTLVVPQGFVHQLVNTGPGLLRVLVALSRPPARVHVFDGGWAAASAGGGEAPRLVFPYTWDTACPPPPPPPPPS